LVSASTSKSYRWSLLCSMVLKSPSAWYLYH
jgi:hypothetical protein